MVEGLLGEELLESGVLQLKLLEPLGLGGLHAAVLLPPAVVAGLAGLKCLEDLGEVSTGLEQPVGLGELLDDLLGAVIAAFLAICHGSLFGPSWAGEDSHCGGSGCGEQATTAQRKKLRTPNGIERPIQQELKRRTKKIRMFPNVESLLRRCSALLVEIDDEWQASTRRYLPAKEEVAR